MVNQLRFWPTNRNHYGSGREDSPMRLATISTPEGPRLHVRGRSGHVDVAAESGNQDLRSLTGFLAGGALAADVVARLSQLEGREYAETELAAAVPEPNRVLCLGLNYREHALEGGRAVPSWPESFVRGRGSVLAPFADLVKPAFCKRFDYEGELGVVIGQGGRYLYADWELAAVAGFTVLT